MTAQCSVIFLGCFVAYEMVFSGRGTIAQNPSQCRTNSRPVLICSPLKNAQFGDGTLQVKHHAGTDLQAVDITKSDPIFPFNLDMNAGNTVGIRRVALFQTHAQPS